MTRAALAFILLSCLPAQARDNGQWGGVDPATREWFRGLSSPGGGVCCDFSDGSRVEDPNWGINQDGTYWTVIDGTRLPVDPANVVRATNRVGFAIAWTYFQNGKRVLRCFLPGTTS